MPRTSCQIETAPVRKVCVNKKKKRGGDRRKPQTQLKICASRSADFLIGNVYYLEQPRNLVSYFQLFLVLVWFLFLDAKEGIRSIVFGSSITCRTIWGGQRRKKECEFCAIESLQSSHFELTMMTSLLSSVFSLSLFLSHWAHLTHNIPNASALRHKPGFRVRWLKLDNENQHALKSKKIHKTGWNVLHCQILQCQIRPGVDCCQTFRLLFYLQCNKMSTFSTRKPSWPGGWPQKESSTTDKLNKSENRENPLAAVSCRKQS